MGPLRVWMKDQDLPGLAMTRSMGDGCAAEAGAISIPCKLIRNINSKNMQK